MRSNKFKKYLDVFLVLFLLVGVFVFIKNNVLKFKKADVSNYPLTEMQLSFDTSISLGKVNSFLPITYTGHIRNIGAYDLHIGNLKTSCGCTNFVVNNLKVKPMDSTKISFSIKPIEKGKDVVNMYFDANTKQRNHRIRVLYEAVKQ